MTTKTNTISKVLEALGVLEKADQGIVNALKADMDLAKAELSGQKSEDMGARTEYVKDHWSRGETNRAATKEEIKTGPSEESSGGGAERMVGHYSNPVRQMHGVASTPEALERHIAGLSASMKSLADSQASTNALLIAMFKGETPVKTIKGKEEEEEDEEESEVVEINAGKAKSKLDDAKVLLKALRKAKEPASKDAIKEDLLQLFAKAQAHVYASGDADLKKSFWDAVTKAGFSKADINVVQEEEDDEEEEAGKAKAAAPAAKAEEATKAVTDDKGNQADSMKVDNGSGNQSDTMKARNMDDLLKGQSMLEMRLNQMMDVMMGKSKIADLVPDISKANVTPDKFEALADKIESEANNGSMLQADAFAAKQILDMSKAVQAGNLDGAIVKARLSKSSAVVRNLFTTLAAA